MEITCHGSKFYYLRGILQVLRFEFLKCRIFEILNNFYPCFIGESVLENLEKKPKKKRKPKIEKSEELDEKKASKNSNTDLTTGSVGQRKRKKKKKHMIETNKDSFETKEIDQHTDTNSQVGKLKHINSIKCELGLTEFKHVQLDKEDTVIKKSRKEPEVVVFTSHKKKQKQVGFNSRNDGKITKCFEI